jgi:sugar phosphate isomerase/epimerase
VLGLEDLEIGVLVWAGESPDRTLDEPKQLGLRALQLGFSGELNLKGFADRWDRALTSGHFAVAGAACSFQGESYTDIPTVQRTVGFVPEHSRGDRVIRTREVASVTAELGIDNLSCHIGFIPHNRDEALYAQLRDTIREICDYCGERGQNFAVETGQEPAKVLLQFIEDVNRSNLKINFDPANMILYGTGEPVEAYEMLAQFVVSVHCKDGDWPPRDRPEALGVELPLGEGSVDMPLFIAKLKENGYKGVLCIEREESDQERRIADIRKAIRLLEGLRGGKGLRAVTG